MKRLSIILILLPLVLFANKAAILCYGREGYSDLDMPANIAKGRITYISALNSKLSIREKDKKEDTQFTITEKTKILKRVYDPYSTSRSNVYVSLGDLIQGDLVIIEFYESPETPQILVAIRIELIQQ